MQKATPPLELARIFEAVQPDLVRVEQEFLRHVESRVQLIPQIGRYIQTSGGKRVRPALLLMAARLAGYTGDRAVLYASVVEFIHTATLVHDDIVDEAEVRRGRLSVHSRWGNDITVLLGDYLYIKSMAMALTQDSLDVIRLRVPPLRERRDDIPLLVDHFLEKFNAGRQHPIDGVSHAAMARLMAHDYPGNVRELENAIEHACVLCPGGVIEPDHLPPALAGGRGDCPVCSGTRASLRQIEASVLSALLRRHGGSRAAVARELGVHPSTVFRKIKALGIRVPSTHARRTS